MNTEIRCQAKKPSTCWKHGQGLGFIANRGIKDLLGSVRKPHSEEEVFRKALKTYNSEHMASVIVSFAEKTEGINAKNVKAAILMAADLHKPDLRANRAHYDKTPYIEHPLRNTLRLIRYGCKTEAVLIGELLHDTVEDHPYEIARQYAKQEPRDEHHAREISYAYIAKRFSPRASKMVHGMSNPIIEDKNVSTADKNISYYNHFVTAIKGGDVLVGKTSDITDNAFSLHYTESGMTSLSVYKKTVKYLMVMDALESRLKMAYVKGDLPVSDKGLATMIRQVQDGRIKLLELNFRHDPANRK